MQNSPQGYGGVYIGLQHDEVEYPGQNKPLRLFVCGDISEAPIPLTVNPRKLEHGFRRICARIPYTLP